jgi:hypothetical protein
VIKVIYGHSDSESSDNKCHKQSHVIYDGSWDIMSRRVVKMLRRAVAAAAPMLRVALDHKWMETSIVFDTSNYPKNIVGAG